MLMVDEVRREYLAEHGQDLAGAKFRIGDFVTFYHDETGNHGAGTVSAVNYIAGLDLFEYLVDGCIYLLWEDQLKGDW